MSTTESSSPIDWRELCEAGFSADGTTEGTRLWNYLDVKRLWRGGRHEHDAEHDETIHDTVTVTSPGVKLSFHFANTELQCCFLVFLIGINWAAPIPRRLTIWQLGNFSIRRIAWGSDGRRREMQKANFWFGNIVPKQWTLSGFLQHTNANTGYI